MKKIYITIASIFVLANSVNSQNLIALQPSSGGTASFFTDIQTAVTAAQGGDYVYIPGGLFPSSITITKPIHIVGVGHNPDSTAATQLTFIGGSITISEGADGGTLEGIVASGTITFSTLSPNVVSNYTVKRCKAPTLSLGTITQWSGIWPCTNNVLITECIFDYIQAPTVTNANINNSIIGNMDGFRNGTSFEHNIFWNSITGGPNNYLFANCYGASFNCGINNCTFRNNIFVIPTGLPLIYTYHNSSSEANYCNAPQKLDC